MVMRGAIVCVLGVLLNGSAWSAVHVEGGDSYATLAEALAKAPVGGTVRLDAGEYAWPPMTIERDVTLLGEGAVVTGGLPNIAQFVVGDAELTLQGLTFEDFEGRVVHATEGSSVVLREIVLMECATATTPLVALMEESSTVTIQHMIVEDLDFFALDAGRLILQMGGVLNVSNSTFSGLRHVAEPSIQVLSGALHLSNSRFEHTNASALVVGGEATVEVIDSTFIGLQSDQGAAIVAQDVTLDVEGSRFEDNVAFGGGGAAIWASGSDVHISDTRFEGQIALLDGAAVYAVDSDVQLVDSRFENNQAVRHGGAVYVEGLSSVSSHRNLYCANMGSTTLGVAGALGVSGETPLQSFNDRFVDNESGDGGALYIGGTGDALVAHATAVRNQGVSGDFVASAGESHVSVRLGVFAQHDGFLAAPLDPTSWIAFDRVMFYGAPGLGEATLGAFVGSRDPMLTATPSRDCGALDLRPRWESEAVDPRFNERERPDLDGSIADLGYHGGPEADPRLWRDDDEDGDPWWSDCAPEDGTLGHGVEERCDGDDDDCDGLVDEDDPSLVPDYWWYTDADGDGFGDADIPPWPSCALLSGWADVGGDCADDDETRHPSKPEWCDAIDHNCDGSDTEGALDMVDAYVDADRDGFGDPSQRVAMCALTDGYSPFPSDCDDAVATTYPGAPEWCDDVDSDCDGVALDSDALDVLDWYPDEDGDGFGGAERLAVACLAPPRAVLDNTDCDDGLASRHPGARERLNDGVDQDCDGLDARLVVPAACNVTSTPTAAYGLWTCVLLGLIRRTCG